MRSAASSLSKYSLAMLIALAQTVQVSAENDAGLIQALASLRAHVNAQDMGGAAGFVPPAVLQAQADGMGITLPELLAEMAAYRIEDLPEPVRVYLSYAPFDLSRGEWHRDAGAPSHLLLPVQITATGSDGHCVTDSTAIIFRDQGWRFLEIGDGANFDALLAAYPSFSGLTRPASIDSCALSQPAGPHQEEP